jgi:hypothetical protein
MKLLKHKNMTATWWEQNREDSNKPRLIGCSRCGRTWCVSPNVPYEEWIAEHKQLGLEVIPVTEDDNYLSMWKRAHAELDKIRPKNE